MRKVPNQQDMALGFALAEQGIQQAADHAGERWKAAAYNAGLAAAHLHDAFTTDAIWAQLTDGEGNEWHPDGDPRAMGHVVRRLKKEGIIADTGRTTNTARKSAHGSTIPIYQSLIRKRVAA